MHKPHGRSGELKDRERPVARGGVCAGLEWEDLNGDSAAVCHQLCHLAELLVHHFRVADLLLECGLPDDQADLRLVLVEDGLLAGYDCFDGPVPRGIVL